MEKFITEPDGFLRSVSQEIYLELKPLSSITDEHAFGLVKITKSWNENNYLNQDEAFEWLDEILNNNGNTYADYVSGFQMLEIFDYLRSKGYALPFMGLSVEELESFGWIKLKSE